MSKYFGFAVVGTIAMLCLLSSYASPGSASQSPAFNGTTLAGWHVLGPAGWRVEKGEIVGSAKAGVAAGWLVLDHAYEDIGLSFSFRCNGCETGVLWRSAKAGAGTEGTIFPSPVRTPARFTGSLWIHKEQRPAVSPSGSHRPDESAGTVHSESERLERGQPFCQR